MTTSTIDNIYVNEQLMQFTIVDFLFCFIVNY